MKFELFEELMSFDTKGRCCIEIAFIVKGSDKFDCCWLGKTPDQENKEDVFWYGLTPDGKNAYDYPSFEAFSSAAVFDGQSLLQVWDKVIIEEINGLDPEEMIELYLSGKGGMGAPQF